MSTERMRELERRVEELLEEKRGFEEGGGGVKEEGGRSREGEL